MDRFALKIAVLCAIAYIYPVITATYVDSHINHIIYGYRYYWMGYWVAIGAVFPFFLAYMSNKDYNNSSPFFKINSSASRRTLFTFLSLYIPILFVLWLNFGPEYPQLAVFSNSFGYGLIIASMVYAHNHKLEYIDSESMSEHAKIEKIKTDHRTWFDFSIGAGIAFVILCVVLYTYFWGLSKNYTNNPSEQFLLFQSFVIDLFVAIPFAVFALREFFKKSQEINNLLLLIQDSRIAGKPEVFIGYAREDYEAARKLYTDLKKAGLDAWLDKESLKGGQRWKDEIQRAIRTSNFFVAVLSKSMIRKKGPCAGRNKRST